MEDLAKVIEFPGRPKADSPYIESVVSTILYEIDEMGGSSANADKRSMLRLAKLFDTVINQE